MKALKLLIALEKKASKKGHCLDSDKEHLSLLRKQLDGLLETTQYFRIQKIGEGQTEKETG